MHTPRLLSFVAVVGCVSTTTRDTTDTRNDPTTDDAVESNHWTQSSYLPNNGWYPTIYHTGTDTATDTDTDTATDADTDTAADHHSTSGNAGWYSGHSGHSGH